MKVAEALHTGWLEIISHKVRSALTCVAIAIGVAAMIYTFSQIAGLNKRMREAFELLGPGRLFVTEKWGGYVSRGLSRGLTWQDAEHIRRVMPELYMVSPMVRHGGFRFMLDNFKNDDIAIMALTPDWQRREWVFKVRGRFLNDTDLRTAARVCVVIQPGGWIQKQWWATFFTEHAFAKFQKHRDLLNRQVKLGDHIFTVVGILISPPRDQDPRWFGVGWNRFGGNIIIVPLSTFRECLFKGGAGNNPDRIDQIDVDTGDASTVVNCRRRIESLLKSLHRGEPDFEIRDYREMIEGIVREIEVYALSVAVIGIVAIMAGGIGIMNVTLATIFSRIREIGIRRALGATSRDILAQFLVEATMLGSLGGLAGAALGIAAVTYLAPSEERMAQISAVHILSAMAIAAATAFIFALYPAYQASRLDPIESLHYE